MDKPRIKHNVETGKYYVYYRRMWFAQCDSPEGAYNEYINFFKPVLKEINELLTN